MKALSTDTVSVLGTKFTLNKGNISPK